MAIILFCQNGHNLSTHDAIYIGPLTPSRVIAMAQRERRENITPRPPFCSECGSPTLDSCQHCQARIVQGPRPGYCGQCGKPFAWTVKALEAAREYADELDLTSADKDILQETLGELTKDTPRTELAVHRFKKIISKIGPTAGDLLTKIIVNVATEAAKNGIGVN